MLLGVAIVINIVRFVKIVKIVEIVKNVKILLIIKIIGSWNLAKRRFNFLAKFGTVWNYVKGILKIANCIVIM